MVPEIFADTGQVAPHLHTESTQQFRGRVMSMSMLTFSAMPLMSLPLGVLADVVGGGGAFVAQGVIVMTMITLIGFANRSHTFARRGPASAAVADAPIAGPHRAG